MNLFLLNDGSDSERILSSVKGNQYKRESTSPYTAMTGMGPNRCAWDESNESAIVVVRGQSEFDDLSQMQANPVDFQSSVNDCSLTQQDLSEFFFKNTTPAERPLKIEDTAQQRRADYSRHN